MRRTCLLLGLGATLMAVQALPAPPLSGAIFTTVVDGSVVNGNVFYEVKEDVYLDGGPGPHAPASAAGLPAGDYYYQVTDPSAAYLLSSDHISCRRIHVNGAGVVDTVYPGTNYAKVQGKWAAVPCQHRQGVDLDHSAAGAITVQLFPYADTPNPGGVYKAWVTPVDDYVGSLAGCPIGTNTACNVNGANNQPGNHHGFVNAASKTDNFKVKKKGKAYTSPTISARKFHDSNMNGVWDAGEEEIFGWSVSVTDPTVVTNTVFTAALVVAEPAGVWTFVEATPPGTQQTAAFRDNVALAVNATVPVTVAGTSGETHAVVYGNVGLGSADPCKVYDRSGNGTADSGEPGVAGYRMQLTGVTILGATVGPIVQTTGADGCTTFGNLQPGSYTLSELISSGTWRATGDTSYTFAVQSTLGSDGALHGSSYTFTFTNDCTGSARFGTKGYWHNVNGLAEMTQDDIDYANSLAPYSAPSSYFGDGDEPFDSKAEVSAFLIDANAGGDAREQLAQQLLAFIFNTRHRLDGPGALIQLSGGSWVSAQSLIDEAIAAWLSNDATWQHNVESVLDWANNHESNPLPFVHFYACDVIYP